MMYRNEFRTVGKLISKRKYDEIYTVLTLMVKNTKKPIFPMIYCKTEDTLEYERDMYIEAECYAESKYVEIKSGQALVPRITALSVRPAKTILEREFGQKGQFCEAEPGILRIAGTIENIKEDEKYTRYMLITENPETKEKIHIRIDWRKTYKHPEFKEGDKIRAVCQISTPKKTIGTEERIFLNFNVIDMDYIRE